jgi:hypothetical protein
MSIVGAYRCSRTGLYFPGDYVEQWGIKYGHMLGPVPVSEALVNDYLTPVAKNARGEATMHGVANCRAQVDFVLIDEEEYRDNAAILEIDDPDCSRRGEIMRARQLVHSPAMRTIFPADAEAANKAEVERRKKRLPLAK